jgi:hypothetical protein
MMTNELVEAEMYLTVNDIPVIRMPLVDRIHSGESCYLGDNLLVTSNSPDDIDFYWTDKAGWSSTEVNPIVSPSRTKRYYLTVTDGNGCVSRETSKLVYVVRGKESFNDNVVLNDFGQFSYYPNPTNDLLNIDLVFEEQQVIDISIENMIGQSIFAKKLNVIGNHLEVVDLQDYSTGMYIIKLKVGEKVYFEKFIKN